MSNPFLGMINIVGFNFAPVGYAFCDGALLSINQNQSLFALLGTTFGGDGRSTFALPDLRGRVPIHVGSSNGTPHALGNKGGEEKHTLTEPQMPSHKHLVQASNTDADAAIPTGEVLARIPAQLYAPASRNMVNMLAGSVASAGANQGHENMMPYGVLKFIIALQGVFPSRN